MERAHEYMMYKNTIKDKELHTLFDSFYEFYMLNRTTKRENRRASIQLVEILEDKTIEYITWEHVPDILMGKEEYIVGKLIFLREVLSLIYYLIDKKLYRGTYEQELLEFKEDIMGTAMSSCAVFKYFLDRRSNPFSFIKADRKGVDRTASQIIWVPEATRFIHEFATEFYDVESNAFFTKRKFADAKIIATLPYALSRRIDKWEDIGDDTFFELYDYYSKNKKEEELQRLPFFFKVILQKMPGDIVKTNFKMLSFDLLNYPELIKLMRKGYTIHLYSRLGNIPVEDKLIFYLNSSDAHLRSKKVMRLDFSYIKNAELRYFVKKYELYHLNVGFHRIHVKHNALKDFLALLDDYMAKESKSLQEVPWITIMTQYLGTLDTNRSDCCVGKYIGGPRNFLRYLENIESIQISPMVYSISNYKHQQNYDNNEDKAFTQEEVEKLYEAGRKKVETAERDVYQLKFKLLYYMLILITFSEIRPSSILQLRFDSIKEVLNKNNYKEYVLELPTKTTKNDFEKYNITKYVKDVIDELIKATEPIRDEIPKEFKNYLFVCWSPEYNSYRRMGSETLQIYLRDLCKEANVPYKEAGGLRKFYMQNISKYVLEKQNGNVMLIPKLSKHGQDVHSNYYDDVSVREFSEMYYGVDLGNVYLKGTVKEKATQAKENTVKGGCGHCSQNHCDMTGKLDCFFCRNFVTTLSCIPTYEAMIEKLDKEIECEELQHEREFKQSLKTLYVGYLTELKTLQKHLND